LSVHRRWRLLGADRVQSFLGLAHRPREPSRVGLGLRAERPDHPLGADAAVEGAPGAPAAAGSELPEIASAAHALGVRLAQILAERLQQDDDLAHRRLLRRRQRVELPPGLVGEASDDETFIPNLVCSVKGRGGVWRVAISLFPPAYL